jgi:hypothetical protein
MEQTKEGKVVKKEPCSICGTTNYTWSALPTNDAGDETSRIPDACSNCHELDDENNIHPKRSFEVDQKLN